LVFINPNNPGFGQHTLYSELHRPLDHVPLFIEVGINETNLDNTFWSICKDREEEENFIKALTNNILTLDTTIIMSKEILETTVQHLANIFNDAWYSHAKKKYITKHSKQWWTHDCTESLNRYRIIEVIEHWREFKSNT